MRNALNKSKKYLYSKVSEFSETYKKRLKIRYSVKELRCHTRTVLHGIYTDKNQSWKNKLNTGKYSLKLINIKLSS